MRVYGIIHRWTRSSWLSSAGIGLRGWVGCVLVSWIMTASVSAYTSYGHNAVGVNTHIPSPQILEGAMMTEPLRTEGGSVTNLLRRHA
jgi:hypothetical protein